MSVAGPQPGLVDAVQRLAASALGGLHNRLALAGLELEEARERLLGTLLLAFGAALAAGATVVALSVWLVLVLWERMGPAAVAVLAVAYAVLCAGLAWRLRLRARAAPAFLADTLAELRRDADAIRPGKLP